MHRISSYALVASTLGSIRFLGAAAASAQAYDDAKMVHGSLGSAAWVVVLPLGAIVMALTRNRRAWIFHACIQVLGLLLVTAGAATGIWFADREGELVNYHAIIGLTLFALVWLLAIGGYLAHVLYKRRGARTIVGHIHLWLGRLLITLGMINGGLGLLLAEDAGRPAYIAYGVVAGVMWVLFSGASIHGEVSKRRRSASEQGELKAVSDSVH